MEDIKGPLTKDLMVQDSIYRKYPEWANHRDRKFNSSCVEGREEKGSGMMVEDG